MNTTRALGEADFGPDALIDLDGQVVAFFDEHAKGVVPDPPRAPVRISVMGANEWRDEQDVNLGTGGDMITETEGVIATNRLWHTPSRPSRLLLNSPAERGRTRPQAQEAPAAVPQWADADPTR